MKVLAIKDENSSGNGGDDKTAMENLYESKIDNICYEIEEPLKALKVWLTELKKENPNHPYLQKFNGEDDYHLPRLVKNLSDTLNYVIYWLS